jgi:uncharacterized membrane protein YfcA
MHPEKKAVVIDYGLATIMLPVVMMGSMTGVLINIMFPSLILALILTAVLASLTIQASCKTKQIYRKETIRLAQKRKDRAMMSMSDVDMEQEF